MSETTIKIHIPQRLRKLLPHLFQERIPGYLANVLDSGNTWVELSTTAQGASVKFGVETNSPVRFYPGSQVLFDQGGNLLTTPDLARSKRPKLLKNKPSKAPVRDFSLEGNGKITHHPKGLGF